VIANWNSGDFLDATLNAIDLYSPISTQTLVVDNGSQDGSHDLVRNRPRVSWIGLPYNIGHEVALDIGFLLAKTEYVVALDVDAFPISPEWIERLVSPLQAGYDVAGAHLRFGFVHPCCLAIRLDRFVRRGHTFVARRGHRMAADVYDKNALGWDTGWSISLRESRRFLIERTDVYGPGDIGSVWDGLIYHNFYSTRVRSKKLPLDQDEAALGVSQQAAVDAWAKAVAHYIPSV
jgi:glycosyltransferase involved in cell wall biosynthesis